MPEFFVGENFCAMFQKVSVSEKLYALERGVSRFSVGSFLVSLCQIFSQWNPFVLCFRKLPLAKEIKNERGVIKIFHRQKICLTVPERFLREHFCAAFEKISGSEKLYG